MGGRWEEEGKEMGGRWEEDGKEIVYFSKILKLFFIYIKKHLTFGKQYIIFA